MRNLLLAAVLLTACDDFSAVQQADTIEAYEAWVAANPDSKKRLMADARLEELYLEAAKTAGTLEAYDAYLARFPEGRQRERAMEAREEMLWAWATTTDTVEAYEKYLAEYPKGKKERRIDAKRAIGVLGYIDLLQLSEVSTARVNMAEDPKGELNGWAIRVDVTNLGTKKVSKLVIRATYEVPARGTVTKDWPLVAPTWSVPLPDHQRHTFLPKETRRWEWTTAELPPEWSREATVKVLQVEFDEG